MITRARPAMGVDDIACIIRQLPGESATTWCGRADLPANVFLDVEHAVTHRENGGSLVACRNCVGKLVKALLD